MPERAGSQHGGPEHTGPERSGAEWSGTGHDVAVVGAGPAGLAAAGQAAAAGARVLLVDAGAQFGGQYWRHPLSTGSGGSSSGSAGSTDAAPVSDHTRFHHGWSTYLELARAVEDGIRSGGITYLPSTHVWSVQRDPDPGSSGEPRFTLNTVPVPEASLRPRWLAETRQNSSASASEPHENRRVSATHEVRALVLCPGAYDRQLPLPGWTTPGVMAAGGVQAFIKTQGISPGRRVLLAGTGPFLLSAAASVLQAGGEVAGICESADLAGWFPRGAAAALVPSKGVEGAEYAALLARHRVPYWRRTVITAVHGEDAVTAATVARADRDGAPRPGTERRIEEIDVVGLGWGFVPQAELLIQLGAQTRVDADGSLVGTVDATQAASLEGLYLAGEITGVAGATAAVVEGRIAGRAAAAKASYAAGSPGRTPARERLQRASHTRFARAMHHAHPLPEGWTSWLTEDTVICRCEEVPWSQVREAAETLEAEEPRTLKGSTRTGMGWCQGRMCGTAASCLSRRADGESLTAVAKRPVALPVRFADLASGEPGPPQAEPGTQPRTQPHST